MRTNKLLFSLLAFVVLTLTGCDNDYDVPPLQVPQASWVANTTILELKTLFDGNLDSIGVKPNGDNYIIKGIIVGNDVSGNIYKNLIIQDNSAALTLSINATSMFNNFRIGQEVVMNCTGMYMGKYRNLQQLGFPDISTGTPQITFMPLEFFNQHIQLNGLPDTKFDTMRVDLGLLPLSGSELKLYQSRLVLLSDVGFSDGGVLPFADPNATSSRILTDEVGNQIIVRNSNYSDFATEILPEGTGSVVGILSYYGSAYQLLLRTHSDVSGFSTTIKEGTKGNPFFVEKAIESQNKNVIGWVKGYIVGSVAQGITSVSQNSDIQFVAPFGADDNIVIASSVEIRDYSKCLVVPLPSGTILKNMANLKNAPSNLGKEILLKGMLATHLGTWGVTQNSGTSAEFELENSQIKGDGSFEFPYTVMEAQNAGDKTAVWVLGIIVGNIDGEGKTIATESLFNPPFVLVSNILISDNPTTTDYRECMPLQLPFDTEVRSLLNLNANPTNKGRGILIKCDLTTYFGVRGIKNITEINFQ